MPILDEIKQNHDEMVSWRRDLHAHPELGFAETRTSAVIQERLRSFGVDALHSFNRTGVLAVIHGRDGDGAIGLRADIDALPIAEQSGVPYASTSPGVMHARVSSHGLAIHARRCIRFEIMLSLSRKMRMVSASSWMFGGVSALHWSNRRPALTANNSSRSRLSGCSFKSIRYIFPAACAHTSKMVADMPGVSWITRASWTASFGLSASMSISQITRNSKSASTTTVEMDTRPCGPALCPTGKTRTQVPRCSLLHWRSKMPQVLSASNITAYEPHRRNLTLSAPSLRGRGGVATDATIQAIAGWLSPRMIER